MAISVTMGCLNGFDFSSAAFEASVADYLLDIVERTHPAARDDGLGHRLADFFG